jgi:ADP-ribose pyrophosphatase YjhB (NUDIX family)
MISCEFPDGHKVELRHLVVDTILIKDGKLLMVKRADDVPREPGKWTLPGGYMDLDERVDEAAKRELLEESGWQSGELILFRLNDNPNRPGEDNQNVNLIFIGEATKRMGGFDDEISEVKWFDLEKIPPAKQIAFDHADNIALYKKWLEQKFNLPVIG